MIKHILVFLLLLPLFLSAQQDSVILNDSDNAPFLEDSQIMEPEMERE